MLYLGLPPQPALVCRMSMEMHIYRETLYISTRELENYFAWVLITSFLPRCHL